MNYIYPIYFRWGGAGGGCGGQRHPPVQRGQAPASLLGGVVLQVRRGIIRHMIFSSDMNNRQ